MEAERDETSENAPNSSLLRILKYNLSGQVSSLLFLLLIALFFIPFQLLGRLSTFLINLYLIRYVDGSVLGLVNVRSVLFSIYLLLSLIFSFRSISSTNSIRSTLFP